MDDRQANGSEPLEDDGIPDLEGPLRSKAATGDEQEGIIPPSDEPRGTDAFGTTAAEQARGDGLSRRLAEEEPDQPAPRTERHEAGQLTERGDAETDDEDELVATESEGAFGEPAEEGAVRTVVEGEVPGAYDAADDGYIEDAGAAGG